MSTNDTVVGRAYTFGQAADRFKDALPTTLMPSGIGEVVHVSAGADPLSREEQRALLETLAAVTFAVGYGLTYIGRTASAHGGEPDGISEELRGIARALQFAASTMCGAAALLDDEGATEQPAPATGA